MAAEAAAGNADNAVGEGNVFRNRQWHEEYHQSSHGVMPYADHASTSDEDVPSASHIEHVDQNPPRHSYHPAVPQPYVLCPQIGYYQPYDPNAMVMSYYNGPYYSQHGYNNLGYPNMPPLVGPGYQAEVSEKTIIYLFITAFCMPGLTSGSAVS
jgi:hypothetical protein